MKVILLKDVEGVGRKHDVKTVKDGYARNLLIPQKLVKIATKTGLVELEKLKKAEVKKEEEHLVETQKDASQLDGQEVEFLVKTGEEGQLFEAITPLKIAKKLREMGFEIKKDQVALDKPIKELGEFPAKINLDHQLEVNITLIIEPETKEDLDEEEVIE